MLKKCLCLALLMLSIDLLAMEEKFVLHTPKVEEKNAKSIDIYVENKNSELGEEILEGAGIGARVPWEKAMDVGVKISTTVYPEGHGFGHGLIGGGLGLLLFLPLELIATLPCAVGAGVGGFINGIHKKIKTATDDKEKRREITRYMLQWLNVVKEGRLKFRAELIARQKDGSVKALVEAMLKDDDTFNRYFGETSFSKDDLLQFLSKIETQDDNLDNFFPELSNKVKITSFSEDEWKILEHNLINFEGGHDEFPNLSKEDIKQYLYMSVYCFTSQTKGLKWLKAILS